MATSKAIGIIGMHRSGTSAMARAINLLGASLGDPRQLMPGNKDNPEGFWENRDIVAVQEGILRLFSRSWDDVRPLPRGWFESTKIKSQRMLLCELISKHFSCAPLWAWKDPRTSLLIPLWLDILKELNIEVCFLIATRNPLDVAASLGRRNGFSKTKSLALWQLYNLSSFYWTENYQRMTLDYDDFLANAETCLHAVAEHFNVPWPQNDAELISQLKMFLRPDLRHGHSGREAVFADCDVSEPVVSAYQLFVSAQDSPTPLASADLTQSVRKLFDDYCNYSNMFVPGIGGEETAGTEELQVFWSDGDSYSDIESSRVGIVADGEFHTYILPLSETPGKIRLDPVNFPAYVEIRYIELLGKGTDGTGVSLYRWGEEETRHTLASAANVVDLSTAGVLRFVATTDDPQLFLGSLPSLGSDQAVNELSLHVMMLVDRHIGPALSMTLKALSDGFSEQRNEEKQIVLDLKDRLKDEQQLVHDLRDSLRASKEKLKERLSEIALLERGIASSRTDVAKLEQIVAHLNLQINNITNSISWRVAAPLRLIRKLQLTILRGWRIYKYELLPGPSVEPSDAGNGWMATDDDPWFLLDGPVGGGWAELRYRTGTECDVCGSLYFDTGTGFTERQVIVLSQPKNGVVSDVLRLPENVVRLRLDPMEEPGSFFLDTVTLRPITRLRVVREYLARAIRKTGGPIATATQIVRQWRHHGWRGAKTWLLSQGGHIYTGCNDYASWVKEFDTLSSRDLIAITSHIQALPYRPLISVIMPVYNTDDHLLRMAIESVRQQVYPNWELCIADDASSKEHVRSVLEEYQAQDDRIKVVFRPENGHISRASNSALALATGEFIALLDHDDILAEHALYMVAVELNAHPDAVLIYSDEDKIDEDGNRYDPYFKSDWNLDLFYGQNMVSHLGVYRTATVRDIGGFRPGLEGSQDYDLALRLLERVTPECIRHIPHVLYHWRAIPGSVALAGGEKSYATDAARQSLQEYFDRCRIKAKVVHAPNYYYHRVLFELPVSPPMISVIIPTRNGKTMLEKCVATVYRTGYKNLEVIVVNNQSDDPETLAYLDTLAQTDVNVLSYDKPFNYAAINNWAAGQAHGEVLLLLNNDVESQNADWLSEMISHACRQEVGIVGAALYYPDDTLQHGGVILGVGGVANHAHLRLKKGNPGYFGRAMLTQDLSAVTAACLMVRKEVFTEAGGLDEELRVAFNDIDFCLRVREKGYLVVFTPYAALYHHESVTRGYEDTAEKKARFMKECDFMCERWGSLLSEDPYYNPNLTLHISDFALSWPPRARMPWMGG